MERPEELSGNCRHVVHRLIEGRLVGLGRRIETADLANELQSGVVKLLVGWSMVWMPQPLDVPTHCSSSFWRCCVALQ
jgi:hypothetical protein